MQKIESESIYWVGVAGALLTFGVIVSSAYLRLVQLGLGCETWPSCYGLRVLDPQALASDGAVVTWMRVAHRLAASAVAVLALAAVVFARRASPVRRAQVCTGVALVALTLLLAVLGRATGSSTVPTVAVANVLGGIAMLALFCRFAFGSPRPQHAKDRLAQRLGTAALALLGLQIALGVLTSAQFAGRACPELFSCQDALQISHRVVAIFAAAALLALAAAAWCRSESERTVVVALTTLTLLELALGVVLVRFDLPLAAATAHSAVAAMLVAAVVRAAFGSERISSSSGAVCAAVR